MQRYQCEALLAVLITGIWQAAREPEEDYAVADDIQRALPLARYALWAAEGMRRESRDDAEPFDSYHIYPEVREKPA